MPLFRLNQNWGGFAAGMIIEAKSQDRITAMLSGIGEPVNEPVAAYVIETAAPAQIIKPVERPVSTFKKQVRGGKDKMVKASPRTK